MKYICDTHRELGKALDYIIQGLFTAHKKYKLPHEMNLVLEDIAKKGVEIPKLIQKANNQALKMEKGLQKRYEIMKAFEIEKIYQEKK